MCWTLYIIIMGDIRYCFFVNIMMTAFWDIIYNVGSGFS